MFKKTFICYIEIFILVVAIFAFAYLIHDIDRKKGSAVERDFSIGKWITLGISGIAALMMGLLVFFFIIYNTEEVSANLASTPICCSKTNSGKWCEMDLPQNCDKNFPTYMSNCSEVNEGYCQKGCCQSQLDGICNPQTSNASCKDFGGEFFPGDSLCGGVSCRIGCCQL